MKWPKYGFTSYHLSCSCSLIVGFIGAVLVITIMGLLVGHRDLKALFSYSPLMCTGLPVITIVTALIIHFLVFTPKEAFWLVRWILQDLYNVGFDIWKDRNG